MPITKIIYSMRIMLALSAKGFEPLTTMPNPKHPEYNCWVFQWSEDLQEELDKILGGSYNGRN